MNTEFVLKLDTSDPIKLGNDEADRLWCIQIENGLICPDGHIYDPSFEKHYTFNKWYHKSINPSSKQIDSQFKDHYLLSLIQIWNNSFQHITFDTLPKLIGIEKLKTKYDNMKILVMNETQKKLLIQFGNLEPSKIITRKDNNNFYQAKKVFYMNFINSSLKTIKLGSSGMNTISTYLPKKNKDKQNICYISRGKNSTRIIYNEDLLLEKLQKFANINNLDFFKFENPKNEVELKHILNHCKIFIGVHGGAMGNMIWCNSSTCIIEVIPKSKLRERPCYYYLANSLGLNYNNIEIDNFEFDIKTKMKIDVNSVISVCKYYLK